MSRMRLLRLLSRRLLMSSAALGILAVFTQAQTSRWHGYARSDLLLAGRKVTVVAPELAAADRPWIWRARFFGHEPQTDLALLARGWHLVYADVAMLFGNDVALAHWDKTYDYVTRELGLSKLVVLEGMSRGGLPVIRWASRHPERVACMYLDAPVLAIRSWPGGKGKGKGSGSDWKRCLEAYGLTEADTLTWKGDPVDLLAPLAKLRVPILSVCGDSDPVVPLLENTGVLEQRYRKLGGTVRVIAKRGVGHHPHSLKDPKPIVDFVLRHRFGSSDYFTLREGLLRCRERFARGHARVAFLGGSITYNSGWRDHVGRDLERRYPATKFEFINAGIPSFGSTPGAFRLARDVFARGPVDLLFVEAAVNDSTNGRSTDEMLRGMEGIVRHARRLDPGLDIVMLHFVDPGKMKEIDQGVVPAVISVHERVAVHYGLPSIDLATEVTERIAAGEFSWAKDFRNLHPSPFGQKLYAATISRLFDQAFAERGPAWFSHPCPEPLAEDCYSAGELVSVAGAVCGEGFAVDPKWRPRDGKGTRRGFVDVPVLVGAGSGSSCSFAFAGKAVGVLVNAGPDAGVLSFRIDGGAWAEVDLLTRWSQGLHLPWSHVLATGLGSGVHQLELRIGTAPVGSTSRDCARIVHFLVDR